jgi:DNA (cytosine-5)-methyltransferase 1
VHEPGITKPPVDKDGNPTSDPNERWYDPDTGRLMQKGISQALRENELMRSPQAMDGKKGSLATASERRKKGKQVNLHNEVVELLRTPSAIEGEGGAISEKQSRERGRMLQVRDQMAQLAAENGLKVPDGIAESLMPTPTAQAAKHGSTPDHGSNTPLGANLWDLPHVLPTPTTQDGKNNAGPSQFHRNTKPLNVEATLLGTPRTSAAHTPTPKQVEAGAPKQRLEDQVASAEQQIINWGRFEQAISRWEQTIGRQAPAPTKGDGKDGAHRLSSAFTEWMMGLPEGWITDAGLSRNDELKACGNGVVPQQAEMALRILLQGGVAQPLKTGTQLPTPTVADTYTDRMESTQQKEGSMHSVTLPQAVRMIPNEH